MKTKAILMSFMALLVVLLVSVVSATSLATVDSVTFNDVEIGSGNVDIAGMAGEIVPVKVTFTANANASDVKVRAEIYGGRDDYVDSTSRFNIIEGSVYTKLLSVELPSDLKDTTKDLTLEVKIYDSNHENDNVVVEYVVKMQRESYEFDIISVDHNLVVEAEDIIAVSVVVKNTGYERSDDGFVTVVIPELGISAKGYIGDLVPNEPVDDEEDSVQKVLYLAIPADAESGIYEMTVRAYNSDSSATVTKAIKVQGSNEETTLNMEDDESASEDVSISVVIWTIVLVVIFVVLLAILVALLMKKDKPVEEVETSYY